MGIHDYAFYIDTNNNNNRHRIMYIKRTRINGLIKIGNVYKMMRIYYVLCIRWHLMTRLRVCDGFIPRFVWGF